MGSRAEKKPAMKSLWCLDPKKTFLNHGSYGACPRSVLEAQEELRREMEAAPVPFMARRYPRLLAEVRGNVCEFLGSNPENLVFVTNATAGVNSVLRSLDWEAGDEILVSDHGYEACQNVASYLAQRFHLRIVVANLPFPEITATEVIARIHAGVSSKTKLVMIDHVTSPTGLVFPLQEVAQAVGQHGIPLLVDGAHAPGLLDLNLERLGDSGVTYYTGNFHKWCCSPKGSAFLWARPAQQKALHPPVVSHGFLPKNGRARFLEEFDWCGTFDPTAWLAIPVALDFLEHLLPGGWKELRARGQDLVKQGRQILLEALPTQALVPEMFLSQMSSVFLPQSVVPASLGERLFEEFHLDAMLTRWNNQTLLRLSAAPYNGVEDYLALKTALQRVGEEERWPTANFA